MQKIKLIPRLVLEILLRCCKFVVLDALGMRINSHQKKQYQLAENFDVYLHAKNHLAPSLLSQDIILSRILQPDLLRVF